MIYQCWNEVCENELIPNHTSWFCCEACKRAYWADAKKKAPRTLQEMQERCQELKLFYLASQIKTTAPA